MTPAPSLFDAFDESPAPAGAVVAPEPVTVTTPKLADVMADRYDLPNHGNEPDRVDTRPEPDEMSDYAKAKRPRGREHTAPGAAAASAAAFHASKRTATRYHYPTQGD